MKKNLPANEIDPTLIKDLIQIEVDDTEISMIDQEPNTSNKCFWKEKTIISSIKS